MEVRDLVVTPVVILMVYTLAYIIRPWVTDEVNRAYFMPALTLKIIGALAVGFIYQFHYGGGDTFNYHTHGSRHIWNAIVESPVSGVQLLFVGEGDMPPPGTYAHASRIVFFGDPSSYAVVKAAAIVDLFTFSAYSSTAVLFAAISFFGMWLFFMAFYQQYPELHRWIAVATFFIPSVFFWGSGLLKDTITLSALGLTTFVVSKLFIQRRFRVTYVILLMVSLYAIFAIKKYILMCYLPAALIWVSARSLFAIRSFALRVALVPFFAIVTVGMAYYGVAKIGEDDRRYSIDKIATTAKVTAYDIGFYTGRDAGSSYALGELDGTFAGMVKLAPQAINVSLFRPYLWEARNPLMLLSALESLMMLLLTLYVVVKKKRQLLAALRDPNTIFCLVFSITFAFAVGVSTFNFGTLTRYKIPLMPFYFLAITFMLHHDSKSDKNEAEAEVTE